MYKKKYIDASPIDYKKFIEIGTVFLYLVTLLTLIYVILNLYSELNLEENLEHFGNSQSTCPL